MNEEHLVEQGHYPSERVKPSAPPRADKRREVAPRIQPVMEMRPPASQDFLISSSSLAVSISGTEVFAEISYEVPRNFYAIVNRVSWALSFMPLEVNATHPAEIYIAVDGNNIPQFYANDRYASAKYSVPWAADDCPVYVPVKGGSTVTLKAEWYNETGLDLSAERAHLCIGGALIKGGLK